MDVAYRLATETDMMGMVHDTKCAIHWMRENAIKYGVQTEGIVLGGGSAGAHLGLLAAYTSNNPEFTPAELEGKDLSVNAMISLYGPSDLEAMYFHINEDVTTGKTNQVVPTMPKWLIEKMGETYYRFNFDKGFAKGGISTLLGGHPDQRPEMYAQFSPITHVHSGCPPTLLIQGSHDVMVPVASTRKYTMHHINRHLHVSTIRCCSEHTTTKQGS